MLTSVSSFVDPEKTSALEVARADLVDLGDRAVRELDRGHEGPLCRRRGRVHLRDGRVDGRLGDGLVLPHRLALPHGPLLGGLLLDRLLLDRLLDPRQNLRLRAGRRVRER
ncbi:hypothetical protein GCM10017778_73490 [Streptomyces vinaceus]|nr:hypothetical protein GCM10017778_73490 [Streptomyces vinaceus]